MWLKAKHVRLRYLLEEDLEVLETEEPGEIPGEEAGGEEASGDSELLLEETRIRAIARAPGWTSASISLNWDSVAIDRDPDSLGVYSEEEEEAWEDIMCLKVGWAKSFGAEWSRVE